MKWSDKATKYFHGVGRRNKHQRRLYLHLDNFELTTADLAKDAGLTRKQASRRLTELEQKGLILRVGRIKNVKLGKMVLIWKRR